MPNQSTALVRSNSYRELVLTSGNQDVAEITGLLGALSPKQRSFLLNRVSYDSDAACARAVGVSVSTVKGWKRSPNFDAALDVARTQPVLTARAQFVLLTNKAVAAIDELLQSRYDGIRLLAASSVLRGRDAGVLSKLASTPPRRRR